MLRSKMLGAVSVIAVALSTGSAHAANYTVSTEADLKAAIIAANGDNDPTSTVTLSGDLKILDPASMPSVTKSLTIEGGGFLLSAAGNNVFTAEAGATLIINSATGGSGGLNKEGAGTVIVSRDGDYSGDAVVVNDGTLRIEGGAHIYMSNAGAMSLSVAKEAGSNAHFVISGAGSKLGGPGPRRIASGANSTGIVTIEKGGGYVSNNTMVMANGANSTATLNVTDAGSDYRGGGFSIDKGEGFVNITNGGKISTAVAAFGSNIAGFTTGGKGTVLVSGAGSHWEGRSNFFMTEGSLTILDQGLVTATYMRIANNADSEASVLVSGSGSEIRSLGNGANSFNVGEKGNGTLTIANGGKVTARIKEGTVPTVIKVGVGTGSGTLNIGGGTAKRRLLLV